MSIDSQENTSGQEIASLANFGQIIKAGQVEETFDYVVEQINTGQYDQDFFQRLADLDDKEKLTPEESGLRGFLRLVEALTHNNILRLETAVSDLDNSDPALQKSMAEIIIKQIEAGNYKKDSIDQEKIKEIKDWCRIRAGLATRAGVFLDQHTPSLT